ncbi:MAG: succinate dehydrogenase cytochrome b subunit [Chthoniobacterales bacterium]
MHSLISFYQSSIGKKWLVAISGVILVGFVTGHMIGNLQIFLGQEMINVYAERLQSLGDLLWVIRGFLLATIVVHILMTVRLAIGNRRARSHKYAVTKTVAATIAARTMAASGSIILCFVIFHLLHFTALKIHPDWRTWHDAAGRHDVYSMMIAGFQDWRASAFYILGIFLLCLHMSHGIQSFLQTLGGRTRNFAKPLAMISPAISFLIFAGYISIPAAVLLGLLKLPAHH